jgi:hypothetical protein
VSSRVSRGIETAGGGTRLLLMCSDGFSLLGDNLNAAQRNIKVCCGGTAPNSICAEPPEDGRVTPEA